MLLKLPQEVLVEVFRYLNFKAKINLATTCKKVKDNLYDTWFYEEVLVPRNRTDEVLLFFQNEPRYGSKVKSCTIYRIPNDKALFIQISAIFPNLTKFLIEAPPFGYDHDMFTDCIKGLSNNLQRCEPSLQMLLPRFTFDNLTEITINDSLLPIRNNPNYYQSLRNTPSLTSLKLNSIIMRKELLEEIHNNCPKLKHFNLSIRGFEMNDTPLGYRMQPADTLETFTMHGDYTRTFTYQPVLNYVVEKYPYLKQMKLFAFEQHASLTEFQESNAVSPVVLNRIVNRIQSLHVDAHLFDYIMNNDDINLANIRDLGFQIPSTSRPMYYRDITGCSKIHLIPSLTSLSAPVGQYIKLLNDEFILLNLRTLVLAEGFLERIEVHLDVLINSCPNLETLDVNSMYVTMSANSTEQNRSFSLRNLRLDVQKVDSKLFDFMRTSLPSLRRLKLYVKGGQRWSDFELPEHTLYEFDVYMIGKLHQLDSLDESFDDPIGNFHTYYSVKTQRETKKLDVEECEDYIDVKRMTAEEWHQEYREVSLSCKELLTMKHYGYIVFEI